MRDVMRLYRVSEETFYEYFAPENNEFTPRIEQAIGQLVRRYEIKGKSILALGARYGREEYFFWKHGNQLALVDIDEQHDIEPVLQNAAAGNLQYFIGDANEFELKDHFDVLFASGFTPDETRRSDIVRQRDSDTYRRMLKENDGTWEWPWWEKPFHPLLMQFAGQLRAGGLMIVQSYQGGFDVLDHRYYLWACDLQLAAAGLKLIECYRFSQTTGVMLYVISKADATALPLFPPITRFHGRGAAERVQCLRLSAHPSNQKSA